MITTEEQMRWELAEAFGIDPMPAGGNGWFQLLHHAEVLSAVIRDRAEANGRTFTQELRNLQGKDGEERNVQ